MIDRDKQKISCESCKMVYADMDKKTPPCERCFPGVNENNVEAMNVFQICSVNSNGTSAVDILEICKVIEVEDQREILLKVLGLTKTIHSLKEVADGR